MMLWLWDGCRAVLGRQQVLAGVRVRRQSARDGVGAQRWSGPRVQDGGAVPVRWLQAVQAGGAASLRSPRPVRSRPVRRRPARSRSVRRRPVPHLLLVPLETVQSVTVWPAVDRRT